MRAARYSAEHERIVKKERAREFIFSSPFVLPFCGATSAMHTFHNGERTIVYCICVRMFNFLSFAYKNPVSTVNSTVPPLISNTPVLLGRSFSCT